MTHYRDSIYAPYLLSLVEVVDPIILDARVVFPSCGCGCSCGCELREVPRAICGCFAGQELALDTNGNQLVVTLGQFSIIKLERDIQLLMPAFDICMPEKECCCDGAGGDNAEDPCEIFSRFDFPVEAFFPPRKDPCSDRFSCHCSSSAVRPDTSCGCGNNTAGSSCGCGSNNTAGSGGCGCGNSAVRPDTSCGCGNSAVRSDRSGGCCR